MLRQYLPARLQAGEPATAFRRAGQWQAEPLRSRAVEHPASGTA